MSATQVDKVETYQQILDALDEAQEALHLMADSEGRTISRARAAKCRRAGNLCDRAVHSLRKAVEL